MGRNVPASYPAEFTVDATKAGKAPLEVDVVGPGDKKYPCDIVDNNDGTFNCAYVPEKKGECIFSSNKYLCIFKINLGFVSFSYRNQPVDLYRKSVDWFLCVRNNGFKSINNSNYNMLTFFNVSVCNFQSMKYPVELNSLLSKFFCYITWLLYHLIRRDIGRLTNEAFTSNPIVSWKQ